MRHPQRQPDHARLPFALCRGCADLAMLRSLGAAALLPGAATLRSLVGIHGHPGLRFVENKAFCWSWAPSEPDLKFTPHAQETLRRREVRGVKPVDSDPPQGLTPPQIQPAVSALTGLRRALMFLRSGLVSETVDLGSVIQHFA